MRLKIILKAKDNFLYSEINNYFIQSLIWNSLKKSDFSEMHDSKKFKFFSFSNIFPVEQIRENKRYNLIISSPNKLFIQDLKKGIEEKGEIRIGIHKFHVEESKIFDLPLRERWITGSPIVLYKNNDTLEYFSFEKHKDFEFFFNRIKENAIKKFKMFYNLEKFEFKFFMFDSFKFKRTIVHSIRKNEKAFVIIGTLGEFKIPEIYSSKMRRFYKFIMDTGLGEKNSLGYGFINPKK